MALVSYSTNVNVIVTWTSCFPPSTMWFKYETHLTRIEIMDLYSLNGNVGLDMSKISHKKDYLSNMKCMKPEKASSHMT